MRDSVSNRVIDRDGEKHIANSTFKVGDVVVTHKPVRVKDNRGKAAGHADVGWKWRIVGVRINFLMGSRVLVYECVAHDAPTMYSRQMRHFELNHKIGRHEGELLGPKVT